VTAGEVVRIVSRRGSVEAPVYIDDGLRPGLAFMTMHFPDEVETNVLTIDAVDPKSGTAEFKASAVRVEKLTDGGKGKEDVKRVKEVKKQPVAAGAGKH
jgi:formate dehydrogenase major subunit